MTTGHGFSAVIDALGIPSGARIETRVPKKLLIEQGMPTAGDKRAVQDGIEDIRWIGALKPNTVGVKAFSDEVREYLEIAILTLTLSRAQNGSVARTDHRAIPSVLLISDDGWDPSCPSPQTPFPETKRASGNRSPCRYAAADRQSQDLATRSSPAWPFRASLRATSMRCSKGGGRGLRRSRQPRSRVHSCRPTTSRSSNGGAGPWRSTSG